MSLFARALGFGLVLLVGAAFLASANLASAFDDEDKQIKAAQKDILDLTKTIEGGKDGADKVKAIKKKYEDLFPIMQIYKPSTKGGLGYEGGPKGPFDGIEKKIIDLGKDKLSAAAVGKQKQALVKVGYLNAALADIAKAYAPTGANAKRWNQYTADMKKASMELVEAAKAADPAKIQSAATNLNTACNGCHGDFRD